MYYVGYKQTNKVILICQKIIISSYFEINNNLNRKYTKLVHWWNGVFQPS